MTDETAAAVYDQIIPGWREAPRNGANRRVRAPYREDAHPSLDIHESNMVWFDRATGEGGGAVDLARRVLGEEKAHALLRELGDGNGMLSASPPRGKAPPTPPPEVEIAGPATSAQIAALKRNRRLQHGDTLDAVGAKVVRCWGEEWFGFPTTTSGSWKLWALNGNGIVRKGEDGRLVRRNVGPVSLLVSPRLMEAETPITSIYDVEGESDFLAAVEAGLPHVIASTGGAGSLAGHKRERDRLLAWGSAEVVVVRDLDDAGREGAQKVAAWWCEQGVPVRIAVLPDELGSGGDLRNYLNGRSAMDGRPAVEPLGDADSLSALADAAELLEPEPAENPESSDELAAKLEELAQLSAVEYDRCRKEEAEALGIRASTLDAEVAARRPKQTGDDRGGAEVLFADVEAWPERVDGAGLLQELTDAYRRFLALVDFAADAMALWTVHAHAHDATHISPILGFASPEKRCGKTTALSLLQRTTPRPLPASNITSAALFRAIERWRPTLIVDEADSFLRDSDELRGILNSSHNRSQAVVIRTVGEDHEPRAFSTWAPITIALIGGLPSTLEDRSVLIQMRRKRPGERVQRMRADHDHGLGDLSRRCARWAADHADALRSADPKMPTSLHDRAQDNWRCLTAIADEAGGKWPTRARKAAEALTPTEDEGSLGVLLLEDVRSAFAAAGNPDRMSSKDLCEALVALPDRPWSEIRRGKALTTNGISRRLRPFGIRPGQRRIGEATKKGYVLEDFQEPFERYLPADPGITPIPTETSKQTSEIEGLPGDPTETSEGNVSVGVPANPADLQGCFDVSVGKGEGEDDELEEVVL